MALVGHVDEISRARVVGWAVDPASPEEPVSLSIFVGGMLRGVCLTGLRRTDVVLPNGEKAPDDHGFAYSFDPPLSPFLEQRIEVMETWSGEIVQNGARVLPRPVVRAEGAGRIPMLVTSTGRSGTTLLMSEFARHPDIVAGDTYPYEIKQIAYHAAAFRALVADADRVNSTNPETMLAHERRYSIGSNPYNESGSYDLGTTGRCLGDYWERRVPSEYAGFFRKLILEFYSTLAAGLGKAAAPYFCEKGDVDEEVGLSARLFFGGVKEILIVRDPRDLLCSSISFWKLPPAEAMAMLQTTFPRLTRIARRAGQDTLVIRYEDLLRAPSASRRAMSEFLGLDLVTPRATVEDAIDSGHRTTRDPAASIGRWRKDLTPEQIATCEATLEPWFHDFGYELSVTSRGAVSLWPFATDQMVVAAEGQLAVSTFFDNHLSRDGDARRGRPVMELTFGRQGSGDAFTQSGWSLPERDYVWTDGQESRLRLPPIRREGDYRLLILALPFIHGDVLPAQNVRLLLDGYDMGQARAGALSVFDIPVPRVLTGSDAPITVTLCLPDAAKPSEVFDDPAHPDHRLLGLSLQRIVLFQTNDAVTALDEQTVRPSIYAGGAGEAAEVPLLDKIHGERTTRALDIIRDVSGLPALDYRAGEVLRDLPGFDSSHLIRLILSLEAEIGVELTEDEADAIGTMADVAGLLRSRIPIVAA